MCEINPFFLFESFNSYHSTITIYIHAYIYITYTYIYIYIYIYYVGINFISCAILCSISYQLPTRLDCRLWVIQLMTYSSFDNVTFIVPFTNCCIGFYHVVEESTQESVNNEVNVLLRISLPYTVATCDLMFRNRCQI